MSSPANTLLQKFSTLSIRDEADKQLQRSNKAQRQESYKQALVNLNQSFEEAIIDLIGQGFNLHPAQAKKLRFKKDRIRFLKQQGLDYTQVDGFETAQILSLISQSIRFEDAIVTADLDNSFPFWKEGYPMVQFDNTYERLAADIQIHFNELLTALDAL